MLCVIPSFYSIALSANPTSNKTRSHPGFDLATVWIAASCTTLRPSKRIGRRLLWHGSPAAPFLRTVVLQGQRISYRSRTCEPRLVICHSGAGNSTRCVRTQRPDDRSADWALKKTMRTSRIQIAWDPGCIFCSDVSILFRVEGSSEKALSSHVRSHDLFGAEMNSNLLRE